VLNGSHPAVPVAPLESPHWKFWGTILWGVLIVVIFLGLQALAVLCVVLARYGNLLESEFLHVYASTAQDGSVVALATLVTGVVCCGLIAGIVKLKKHSIMGDYLALRAIPLRTMLKWLGLLAALLVASDVLTVLLERPIVPDFMSEVYATAHPSWLLWLALVVAAPLFEETFFRGFLFKGLESSFLGILGTVLVTAGLWALMHIQYDAYGIATIFCLGVLLGSARARTGSLLVPLALHSVANLVATLETVVMA
jgi:hypothetical protein